VDAEPQVLPHGGMALHFASYEYLLWTYGSKLGFVLAPPRQRAISLMVNTHSLISLQVVAHWLGLQGLRWRRGSMKRCGLLVPLSPLAKLKA